MVERIRQAVAWSALVLGAALAHWGLRRLPEGERGRYAGTFARALLRQHVPAVAPITVTGLSVDRGLVNPESIEAAAAAALDWHVTHSAGPKQ